jgi:hypothetical protein
MSEPGLVHRVFVQRHQLGMIWAIIGTGPARLRVCDQIRTSLGIGNYAYRAIAFGCLNTFSRFDQD